MKTIKQQVFKGYFWNMLGKLVLRGLGLISTLVLVRLLAPNDFGVVAIGMLVIGLFLILSSVGVNRYLILHDDPKDSDFNAGWTLNIVLISIILCIVLLSVPFLSSFLDTPELSFIIPMLCLTSFLGAFKNIGLVKYEKSIDFLPLNKILVVAKICSFCVTIATAFYFKNYYALVLGNLANQLITVYASYKWCDYRPKFHFSFPSKMFRYSKGVLIRSILGYTRSQLDILVVTKLFGTHATGKFKIARDFSILPQTELLSPAMQPIFSGLAKFKSEPEKLLQNSLTVLFVSYLFLMPSAFGLFLLAEPFTMVVLGEKWEEVSDFIGILAFLMLVFITQPILHTIYDANDKVGYSMLGDVVGIVTLLSFVFAFSIDSLQVFAQYRFLTAMLTLLSLIIFAKIFVNFPVLSWLKIFIIPFIAALGMYVLLYTLKSSEITFSYLEQLILFSALGVFVYSFICVLLLVIMGRYFKSKQVFMLIEVLPKRIREHAFINRYMR